MPHSRRMKTRTIDALSKSPSQQLMCTDERTAFTPRACSHASILSAAAGPKRASSLQSIAKSTSVYVLSCDSRAPGTCFIACATHFFSRLRLASCRARFSANTLYKWPCAFFAQYTPPFSAITPSTGNCRSQHSAHPAERPLTSTTLMPAAASCSIDVSVLPCKR